MDMQSQLQACLGGSVAGLCEGAGAAVGSVAIAHLACSLYGWGLWQGLACMSVSVVPKSCSMHNSKHSGHTLSMAWAIAQVGSHCLIWMADYGFGMSASQRQQQVQLSYSFFLLQAYLPALTSISAARSSCSKT